MIDNKFSLSSLSHISPPVIGHAAIHYHFTNNFSCHVAALIVELLGFTTPNGRLYDYIHKWLGFRGIEWLKFNPNLIKIENQIKLKKN